MPEGPIIIILKEELQQFKHKEVIAANGYTPNLDPNMLIGQKLTDIKSWGKHLLLCFPKFTVRVHLMLFGSWRINSRGKNNASLGLEFPNGEVNFYISSIKLITQPLDEVYDWQADVMGDKWDTEHAIEKLLAKPKAFIGDVLLDQKIFSLGCLHVVVLYITISPSHRNTVDDGLKPETLDKETIMNTSISTKLTALALALMVNSVIMGGMAYLFNAQLQPPELPHPRFP